jgi:hypothetical protein
MNPDDLIIDFREENTLIPATLLSQQRIKRPILAPSKPGRNILSARTYLTPYLLYQAPATLTKTLINNCKE